MIRCSTAGSKLVDSVRCQKCWALLPDINLEGFVLDLQTPSEILSAIPILYFDLPFFIGASWLTACVSPWLGKASILPIRFEGKDCKGYQAIGFPRSMFVNVYAESAPSKESLNFCDICKRQILSGAEIGDKFLMSSEVGDRDIVALGQGKRLVVSSNIYKKLSVASNANISCIPYKVKL